MGIPGSSQHCNYWWWAGSLLLPGRIVSREGKLAAGEWGREAAGEDILLLQAGEDSQGYHALGRVDLLLLLAAWAWQTQEAVH